MTAAETTSTTPDPTLDGHPDPPDGFVAAAPLDAVPPGWVLGVTVGARELAIANADGDIIAVDGRCSHAGGPLGDNRLRDGCLLECPWHNAVFDVRDHSVARGPARKPQQDYPVQVRDGTIFVALG